MENIERHVSLRDFHISDADDFMEWAGDDAVTRHLSWETYTSKDQITHFISTVILPHPFFKAICFDGTPVGSIALDAGAGIHSRRSELGYVVARKHWSKGITTQAVKLALAAAFDDLGFEWVEAFVQPFNVASKRVLEKAGLKYVGLFERYIFQKGSLRDVMMFSISSREYREQLLIS